MKIVAILIICSLQLLSNQTQRSFGLGVIVSQSEYKGEKAPTPLVIPMFTYESDHFYLKGIEAGYKFINEKNFKLSAVIQPRFQSFKEDDSKYFEGMENRDKTLEAGIKLKVKPVFFLNLQFKGLYDLLDVHNGYLAQLRASTMFVITDEFLISPFLGVTYLSSHYTNYYYGVNKDEISNDRTYYKPSGSLSRGLGANFIYKFTKNLSSNLILKQTFFDNQIYNSPIVQRDKKLSAIMGISYKF